MSRSYGGGETLAKISDGLVCRGRLLACAQMQAAELHCLMREQANFEIKHSSHGIQSFTPHLKSITRTIFETYNV